MDRVKRLDLIDLVKEKLWLELMGGDSDQAFDQMIEDKLPTDVIVGLVFLNYRESGQLDDMVDQAIQYIADTAPVDEPLHRNLGNLKYLV
jgi:hypothetical protein